MLRTTISRTIDHILERVTSALYYTELRIFILNLNAIMDLKLVKISDHSECLAPKGSQLQGCHAVLM